jgi:pyridoxamine 5'-phosphate oxidase
MNHTARLEHLNEVEAAVWRELQACVQNKSHAWRVGVLATRDGEGADARSVVLREVDAAERRVLIYMDARSPKARQIQAHPAGTLVLWSREMGWQLRLRVQLSLMASGLAVSSRWARLKMTPGAQDYLSPLPPGSTLNGDPDPTPASSPQVARESRDHFAVIAAEVQSIDWLELRAQGHRRAVFEAGQQPRWVVP